MRHHLILFFLLAPLSACGISEENFPEAYGRAVCARSAACDVDAFDALYDDQEDCIDDVAATMELALDVGDVLKEYDPAKGGDCVADVRSTSCDDLSAGDLVCELFED